jgi:hypothetical protein
MLRLVFPADLAVCSRWGALLHPVPGAGDRVLAACAWIANHVVVIKMMAVKTNKLTCLAAAWPSSKLHPGSNPGSCKRSS